MIRLLLQALPGRRRLPFLIAAAMIWTGTSAVAPAAAQPGTLDAGSLYRAQSTKLAEEVAGLRPGVPGKVELFAVLAAWYPDQRVFLREVEAIGGILEERFDARGRVVTLASSAVHPERHPLATPINLASAIDAVRMKMNPEDVLLLYITSHGAPEVLSAGRWAVGTPPLLASQLGAILDRADVPNIVAVISACHSGSFIPALRAPDRLVITAAAADRTSFGCSNARDWTYFGEALFDRALRATRSLPEAFGRAAALVGAWERAQGFTPSQPQMVTGEEIGGALNRLARDAAAN